MFNSAAFLKPYNKGIVNDLFEYIYSTYDVSFSSEETYTKFLGDYIYSQPHRCKHDYFLNMDIYKTLVYFGFMTKDNNIMFLKKKKMNDLKKPELFYTFKSKTFKSKRNANKQLRTEPIIYREDWPINNSSI